MKSQLQAALHPLFPKDLEWKVEQRLLQEIEATETPGQHSGHRFHIQRYLETFRWLPKSSGLLLDLGGTCGMFGTILREFTSYTTAYADHLEDGNAACFDFEKDPFPYADESFDVVLFTEVLEHLKEDPMHAMLEIHRILKPDGRLLLSTPNIASWKSIRRSLHGEHPGLFVQYMRHGGSDRHNREYTAKEVRLLLENAGFEVVRHDAIDVYAHVPGAEPLEGWPQQLRGDTTFCLGKKVSQPQERYPQWLYWPAV